MKCYQCGYELPPTAKFCRSCGTKQSETAETIPIIPATTTATQAANDVSPIAPAVAPPAPPVSTAPPPVPAPPAPVVSSPTVGAASPKPSASASAPQPITSTPKSKTPINVVVGVLILAVIGGGGYWGWTQKKAADERASLLLKQQAEFERTSKETERVRVTSLPAGLEKTFDLWIDMEGEDHWAICRAANIASVNLLKSKYQEQFKQDKDMQFSFEWRALYYQKLAEHIVSKIPDAADRARKKSSLISSRDQHVESMKTLEESKLRSLDSDCGNRMKAVLDKYTELSSLNVSDRSGSLQASEPPKLTEKPPQNSDADLLERASKCENIQACMNIMLEGIEPRKPEAIQVGAARIGELNKAQRGDRRIARDLNKKGLDEFKNNDLTAAIDILKRAAAADPLDVEIPSNLGFVSLRANRNDIASDALTTALLLDARRTSTWVPLAELFAIKGNSDAAIRALLLGYEFSTNKEKGMTYYEDKANTAERVEMRPIFTSAVQKIKASLAK